MNNQEIANYKEFVDVLGLGLQNLNNIKRDVWEENATKYVNGFATEELRRLVDIKTRKEFGIFFTDSKLARTVFEELRPKVNKDSIFYDPACGVGNLIIAAFNFICENKIKIGKHEQFLGTDIHNEFIDAAKLRCSINKLLLTKKLPKSLELKQTNFNFRQADGLDKNEFYDKATHIIVNPPFNLTLTDEKLSWSNGKVSAAALFMERIIRNVGQGTSIYAILPDVLRSGSRYEKWRKVIQENCSIGKTKLLGQFDKYTDVDVFAIELTKRKKSINVSSMTTNVNSISNPQTVGDMFDVCVGPVVDNRDVNSGPCLNYIVSRGLKGWTIQRDASLTRQHEGKSFIGPFVVVKRTSRMGDSQRAIATIINLINPVFVDNHLIVLKPKSGKLKDCRSLLAILKNNKTDEWLNDQIRCRHLTVKIVSKIPVWH